MLKCNLVSSGPKGTKNEQSIGKVEKVLLRIHPKRAFERRESRKQIKPALKSILSMFLVDIFIAFNIEIDGFRILSKYK